MEQAFCHFPLSLFVCVCVCGFFFVSPFVFVPLTKGQVQQTPSVVRLRDQPTR